MSDSTSTFDLDERHFMSGGFFANHSVQHTDEAAVFDRYREWCDAAGDIGVTSLGVALPWEAIQSDGPEQFEWSFLNRWFDYAVEEADQDLVVIVDETGVSAPDWLDTERYAQRTPDGEMVTTHGGKPVFTLHSDELDAHVTRLYRHVADHVTERYGDHVVGLQNVTWPNMESTYPGDIDHTDYSERAQTAFRDWLRERYASIGALNDAWGTDHDDFDAVAIGTEPAAKTVDVRKFRAWSLARHVEREYRVVKDVDPSCGFFLRSGGLDDWDDVHGEKTSLVAAQFCDIVGEDNEYPRPYIYGDDTGHAADINYYRTGADVRGIGWNMELDSLEIGNSELGGERVNQEYRDNGLYGYDLGCQLLNICHWEPGSLDQYGERSLGPFDDTEAWTYLPQLATATEHAVSEFATSRAYYYSYWGGLADAEVDLRRTYDEHTLYGDRQFLYDVIAAPLYVDPEWETIAESTPWDGYDRGIWVPDGRVLGAVERAFLTRAYRDGVTLSLSRPADLGTRDEYGRETDPLVTDLRAIGDEQGRFNASVGYRPTDGDGPWSYATLADGHLQSLQYDAADGRWHGPDGESHVGPHRQRPTLDTATVRVWEAPRDGTVTVSGSAESVQKFPATGTTAVAVHHLDDDAVGENNRVWPDTESAATVHANRPVVESHGTLTVAAGDRIAFVARAADSDGDHAVDWTPELRYKN
jgi:hypothetical protein